MCEVRVEDRPLRGGREFSGVCYCVVSVGQVGWINVLAAAAHVGAIAAITGVLLACAWPNLNSASFVFTSYYNDRCAAVEVQRRVCFHQWPLVILLCCLMPHREE